MESIEFTYWLQGAIEMNPEMLEKGMSPQQVKTIQDHLDLVFNKITPDRFKNHVVDYNSSGNTPPEHPGSTCVADVTGELFCQTVNLLGIPKKRKSLMTLCREEGSSPSTGGIIC